MDVTDELCRKAGVIFVPTPEESINEHGFLKKEFYAEDATHANQFYGALLLSYIQSSL